MQSTCFSLADLRAAFMAGFTVSGEGFNGEWPFSDDDVEIDNALDGAFNRWLSERSAERPEEASPDA